MACCLFVAFLIGQIFLFRDRVKRFFGMSTAEYNVDTDTVFRPAGGPAGRRFYRLAVVTMLIALPLGLIAWHWHHILMWAAPAQARQIANIVVKSDRCTSTEK